MPISAWRQCVDQIRADPDVKRVTGRLELENGLLDKSGQPIVGHPAQVIGISRPDDDRVENLAVKSGDWFGSSTGDVAVIDQVAADKLGVGVGDTFWSCQAPALSLKLPKVVGIVQKPLIPRRPTFNRSICRWRRCRNSRCRTNRAEVHNRVMIDLKINANLDLFVRRWQPKLTAIDPSMKLRLLQASRQSASELDSQSPGCSHPEPISGGSVSMLAATFIVFSRVQHGREQRGRSRTLAMMYAHRRRAPGTNRTPGCDGGAGSVGDGSCDRCAAGMVVDQTDLLRASRHSLGRPQVLSRGGVSLGAGGSILAALLASLLPAWNATRVSPLEALHPMAMPESSRLPVMCAIAGLLLIGLDPVILFGPWERLMTGHAADPLMASRQVQIVLHFLFGLPLMMFGFFLLSPAFVWILERLAGPIVAPTHGLACRCPSPATERGNLARRGNVLGIDGRAGDSRCDGDAGKFAAQRVADSR